MHRLVLICLIMLIGGAGLAYPVRGENSGDRAQDRLLEYKRRHLPLALQLDQSRVERLLEVERRHRPELRRLRQEVQQDLQRLRQLLQQPQPSQAEAKTLLESLQGKRNQLQSLRRRQMDEEMALITPVQQARYLIFEQQMRRQLLQQVRSLKGEGRQRQAGGRPPSPAVPPDIRLPDLPLD